MDDRQTRYEEYRQQITGPVGRQMSEKLRDTVYSYTHVSGNAENKLIIFGFLSGVALACSGRVSGIACTALVVVAAVCFLYALYAASENRKKRGEDAFYRYLYGQIISEKIHWDQENQARVLLSDMQDRLDILSCFAPKELVEERNVDEFRKRTQQLRDLTYYEKQLKEDYWFSKSMHDYLSD